jgi:hypothetical protein
MELQGALYQAFIFGTTYSIYTNMQDIYSKPPYGFNSEQIGILYLGPGLGFLIAILFLGPPTSTQSITSSPRPTTAKPRPSTASRSRMSARSSP